MLTLQHHALWVYSVEKLRFRLKSEIISPHNASVIFRRGVRQNRDSKPCCVSLEPFAAIFPEFSQEPVFGGKIRSPISRFFQQNRLTAAVRCAAHVGPLSVFVKGVVRRFHAASLISSTRDSRSGLSQTGPAGCQLRVLPDQRSGFCARAFA
jgi:hypothetical protein